MSDRRTLNCKICGVMIDVLSLVEALEVESGRMEIVVWCDEHAPRVRRPRSFWRQLSDAVLDPFNFRFGESEEQWKK